MEKETTQFGEFKMRTVFAKFAELLLNKRRKGTMIEHLTTPSAATGSDELKEWVDKLQKDFYPLE